MLTTIPRLPKIKIMRGKNTIGLCSCNQSCVLMTNKNCLEIYGNIKLSTWLSKLLWAELRIFPLGDSCYPSVHAGLYQETYIKLPFTLAYTKRLVLSFCSRWHIPRDSYYPSVHAGLYQETYIKLLFTLAYTKRIVLYICSRWTIQRDSYYTSVHASLYKEKKLLYGRWVNARILSPLLDSKHSCCD
jgi:hypothetical protein